MYFNTIPIKSSHIGDNMKNKIIAQYDWGTCPKCKSKMIYFLKNYQSGYPGEDGTYITYILHEDTFVEAICPRCKFQIDLVHTINGICSKEHAKEHNYISGTNEYVIESKENPIGVTIDDENFE